MRDGLHKDLPLGRAWKGVVRACTREAERGATARERAELALAADVKNEVSKAFLDDLRSKADHSACLLPTFHVFADAHEAGTPLETEIRAGARNLEHEGIKGRPLVERAIKAALKDRGERRTRQIAQHCSGEGAVLRAAAAAIRDADLSKIVEPLLDNKPLRTRPKRRQVDLDEDLTHPQ